MKIIEYSKQDIVLSLMINAYDIIKESPDANFGQFNIVDSELVEIISNELKRLTSYNNEPCMMVPNLREFNNEVSSFLKIYLPDGTVYDANKAPIKEIVGVYYYGLKEGITLDSPTSDTYFPDYVINVFRRKAKKEFLNLVRANIMHPSKYKFFKLMAQKYQKYAGAMDMDVLEGYYSEYEIRFLKYCNSHEYLYRNASQFFKKDY